MTILYDPKAMNELFSDLQEFGGRMRGEISELETAATNFKAALTGDNAHANFEKAHSSVHTELSDTLTTLDKLAGAVESALNRALEADGKVGDGFADF
ncbi:WXG100 family type VII secretion target [Nocardia sp. XZ_19_231]|uniref:WXG100 family type VII secretion target n=1 Tax=Nocardia sp. XZ_19_231 TaxID=2769252 RepID=UPI001E5348C9|nr:type VII secretion protein EsxR [Nocardia sp. XZ_19_231]